MWLRTFHSPVYGRGLGHCIGVEGAPERRTQPALSRDSGARAFVANDCTRSVSRGARLGVVSAEARLLQSWLQRVSEELISTHRLATLRAGELLSGRRPHLRRWGGLFFDWMNHPISAGRQALVVWVALDETANSRRLVDAPVVCHPVIHAAHGHQSVPQCCRSTAANGGVCAVPVVAERSRRSGGVGPRVVYNLSGCVVLC